jgi:hypothetical protein
MYAAHEFLGEKKRRSLVDSDDAVKFGTGDFQHRFVEAPSRIVNESIGPTQSLVYHVKD